MGKRQEPEFDLVVIGELNIDLILTAEEVMPEFGQREKLVEDFCLELGSSSAIFASQAAKLGLRTAYMSKVGDDQFGEFLLKGLTRTGIDISRVIVDGKIKTGITLHLSKGTDRAMLTYLGCIGALRSSDIDLSLVERSRHLHVSSFFLQKGIQRDLADIFGIAKDRGLTVSLDTGWDPDERWNGSLEQALRYVDVFLPNQREALCVSGTTDLEVALAQLGKRIPIVAVKRGPAGAIARAADQTVEVEGFLVEAVDTIGAGDSFDAGFIYGYLNGLTLRRSLEIGSACGALSTTAIGGTRGQPTLQEVERFLGTRVPS